MPVDGVDKSDGPACVNSRTGPVFMNRAFKPLYIICFLTISTIVQNVFPLFDSRFL